MASFSLPNHYCLSSPLPPQTRTNPSPQNPQVFSKLPKSQFHGVKLSNSASLSFPSSSSAKSVIFAKVHCSNTRFYFVSYGLLSSWKVVVSWLWLLCYCCWKWRWKRVRSHLPSHWKIRMEGLWASPNSKGSLWLSISILLMRPLAAPNRYSFFRFSPMFISKQATIK